jgi:hypothetical protein
MRRAPASFAVIFAATCAFSQTNEVKLPLKDYLALVDKAESSEKTRAAAKVDPTVAEVTSQATSVVVHEKTADLTTVLEVEVRGAQLPPVFLSVTGLASKATLKPQGGASLTVNRNMLTLVAPDPGHYTVVVTSTAGLAVDRGIARLTLAPVSAPVALTEVELPAALTWSCPGTVVVDDQVTGEKRHLRLATKRGQAHTFEARREVKGAEEEKTLARTVIVTLAQAQLAGTRRHDIVLYEVSRGGLGAFTVTLPEGLEVERLATDEGEAPPLVDGRKVVVGRTNQLTGTGYLAITSTPTRSTQLSLAPIVPEVETRARYLAFATSVAAEATPAPAEAWSRADIGDLPEMVRAAADGIKLAAAWRAIGEAKRPTLGLALLPAVSPVATLVSARETTTLLTKEGTLLHRDVFTIAQAGAAFEITLPTDAELWSASVNDMPIRTFERNGATLVPLTLGAQAGARVEVVVVQKQAIPTGRSQAALAPPRVDAPVLLHTWRLLLPAQNRYRYTGGTLRPELGRAPEVVSEGFSDGVEGGVEGGVIGGVVGGISGGVPAPLEVPDKLAEKPRAPSPMTTTSSGAVTGRITDGRDALPGVSIKAESGGEKRFAVSSVDGSYSFPLLPPGRYDIRFELSGFQAMDSSVEVRAGQPSRLDAAMPMSAVTEAIAVQAAPSMISQSSDSGSTFKVDGLAGAVPSGRGYTRQSEREQREAHAGYDYSSNIANLKQGLVGGVKPVPVSIPETGKALVLVGVLPPAEVTIMLEVKAK